MVSEGSSEESGSPEGSFTRVLLTVQSLEDELSGAKDSAKRAMSQRDLAEMKVKKLEEELSACKLEMQNAVSELQQDKQHWTAQAKAAESEKVEISKRAEALKKKLEMLTSSRDRNYQALKEKQYKAELEMDLKKDECNRMQKQLKSYAGLLSALETELAKTQKVFTEAKTMVTDNCTLVSRQEEKLQKVIIAEECFLGKIRRQAVGFKALRTRLQEKEQALKEVTTAHDTAVRQLASSTAKVAELRRTVELVEAGEKEHIAAKNALNRSLQRSNALLAEARAASEQHRAALDMLRAKLQALDAVALEQAARDAAIVKEQNLELAGLRSELETLRGQLEEKINASNKKNMSSSQHPDAFAAEHAGHSPAGLHMSQATSSTMDGTCKMDPQMHISEPKQGPEQTSSSAKDAAKGQQKESGPNNTAHKELDMSGAPEATALETPAGRTSEHDSPDQAAVQNLPVTVRGGVLQTGDQPLQQQQNGDQRRPWEQSCEQRNEQRKNPTAYAADTPDELDLDGEEDLPQRLQQPHLAQQGMLPGKHSGGGRDMCSEPKPSPQGSSIQTATEYHGESLSEPSEPKAKKPRTADPEAESSPAPNECDTMTMPIASGSAGAHRGTCSHCDLFASFTSLQDLSDDEVDVT